MAWSNEVGLGGKQTTDPKKNSPLMWCHTVGKNLPRWELTLEERGVDTATSSTPAPEISTGEMSPKMTGLDKSMGLKAKGPKLL